MTSRGWTRAPRRGRATALLVALLLVLSGCYTETARQHQAGSPETRPYYCNAVGNGTPPGGHGNGSHLHPIYEGMTKGPLSWEDCLHLSNQLDELLTAVDDFPTRSAGEAAGWRMLAEHVPGLGTHHGKQFFLPGTATPEFDPSTPLFLVYGGTAPDAPLVGVSYAANGSDTPPEGFAGNNDWWHLHKKVCMGSGLTLLAGAEEIPDEECAALGGRQINLGAGIWLLHLWIIPDYQLKFDVFVSGHPCLGETAPLPWDDPCWEELANHDPADGPLPGSEHDEHGGHEEHGIGT
jgi:hypothetical protein